MNTFTVSIEIEVQDENELLDAAVQRAQDEGSSFGDAVSLLKTEDGEVDVGACLQMLFDPGTSPPGCKIIESYVS